MQLPLVAASTGKQAIENANDPQLRLFGVPLSPSLQPMTQMKEPEKEIYGQWRPSTPDSARPFSAVSYFFGLELRRKLKVPVGLINASWGGTPAEAWTSLAQFQSDPELLPLIDEWDRTAASYPADIREFRSKLIPRWKAEVAKAKENGQPEPQRPREPQPAVLQKRPSSLYNGMIAPLIPFAMKGAIWYQGENNAWRANGYHRLLSAMIAGWRRDFGAQKPQDFAFYIVQLANFKLEKPEPTESEWAELREAQAQTAKQPGNGLALAIDIGVPKDIHPKNKQEVGRRLALAALAQTYGEKIEYSGPLFESMKIEGSKIRLKFSHAAGLMSKSEDANAIPWFAIAGADKTWKWANVRIEGQEIVVWNETIAAPVAVRYAWADNPKATIYNAEGLPAVPFRTDNWPGIAGKE
jgi:sialate O-acetylesterase